METKGSQLQIRVSARQKRALREQADAAGTSISEWVLSQVFPPKREQVDAIVREVPDAHRRSFALAALSDLLAQLEPIELERTFAVPLPIVLPSPWDAFVAAMIEHAASLRGARVPDWVLGTPPAREPYFASELCSVRLHLLACSPTAFRRRNLFVDSTVGDRV